MIKVQPKPEPVGFDEFVRKPGVDWLRGKATLDPSSPRSFWNDWNWTGCREALAAMFAQRCGYTACWIPSGQVEHFVSWKECKRLGQRHLAYEWTNYRWIMPQLNGRKGTKTVLDPFEVEDDWFEINLFTLQLRLTNKVPTSKRKLAEDTLDTLGLKADPLVCKIRREALSRFEEGTPLKDIARYSPLIARALKRLLDSPLDTLSAPEQRLRRHLKHQHQKARERETQP